MQEEIIVVFTIHHPYTVTEDSRLSEHSFAKSGWLGGKLLIVLGWDSGLTLPRRRVWKRKEDTDKESD